MISDRTKKALAASTKMLGGVRYREDGSRVVLPSREAHAASLAARQARAEQKATDLAPTIKTLQAGGATSLKAIGDGLNSQGIPTARGGEWSPVQVQRVLARL
jgi:hypothetical protein